MGRCGSLMCRRRGYTLVELVVVLSIIAVLALTLLPQLSSGDPQKLDMATAEVVAALRFARGEAMRKRAIYGVHATETSQRLRVYWLDSTGPPAPTYTVRHPVDKQLYTLDFASSAMFQGIELGVYFKYAGVAQPRDYLDFDASGAPSFDDNGSVYQLQTGAITLKYRDLLRVIVVTPRTGRVTVL